MTQPTTTVEVEFLPVYVPSEYEKQNPKAFAEGVRNVMAKYVVYSVVYICINVNPGHVFKIFT
jgi:lysophosphatidylcholine acyltransferase/lyso-PAF acetyltransferase